MKSPHNQLASLRTTVATNTCALYTELSIALGTALDPFADLLFTNLLRMASLTKKIAAQNSQATVTTLIEHLSAQPKIIIPLLWNTLQDKAIQTRSYAISHVKHYLEVHGTRATHAIEATGAIDLLEKIVKKALGDANAGVRDNARQMFWIFHGIWSERGAVILQALDSASRKQLEKACPNPEALATMPSAASPPKAKKSSVAAAIAASRAKAKAIATAPPTLRHQATSTSHTIRATSPPTSVRRATSPSLSTSSSTGGIRASSPVSRASPPRSRMVSGGTLSRSTSASLASSTTARSPPRQPQSASPPSPTSDQTSRRRLSSPLNVLNPSPPTSNSTFRKAVETALPASPPGSVDHFTSPTPRPPKVGQAVPVTYRESLSIAGLHQLAGTEEESLLLATNIPVPEDSDSDMEMDESVNLISFSTPYEVYPPAPRSNSQANSLSHVSSSPKRPFSNALSTGTSSPPAGVAQPLVEDAMRARAEQAESAAERLLELVEPEEDLTHPSPIPAALLLRNGEGQGAKPKPRVGSGSTAPTVPRTPVNNNKRNAAIMQQAALFQDSPAYNGKTTSLFALVDGRDSAGQWWAKRMACTCSVCGGF